jgi:hypothetical protein
VIPWLGGAESDEGIEVFGRQKAFILKQGDGMPVADICPGRDQPGDGWRILAFRAWAMS